MTAAPSIQARNRLSGLPLWLDQCLYPQKGQNPYPNIANVIIGLTNDPDFQGRIAFDDMQCHPTITAAIPEIAEAGPWPRPIEDAELLATQKWFQHRGLPNLTSLVVHDGLRQVAYQNRTHPLRDWLKNLVWDHQPRVEHWLHTYLGTEDDPYHATVGSCFLISMVARIFSPGCKADHMLVLEGGQGKLKSTAAATLAGPQYFSDDLPDLAGDPIRASMHLRGKWLIEVAELSAFSRAEASRLKSFISRQQERYTPKYARLEVVEPRQCALLGTTNKSTYLRDETGGRRFWPVTCGPINIPKLEEDRSQIFAEAVHAFRANTPWWPAPHFEDTIIKPRQENRYEGDAWEEKIADHYNQYPSTQTTLLQIAINALGFTEARIGTADQRRIIAAIEHLGWAKGPRQKYGYVWLPPKS